MHVNKADLQLPNLDGSISSMKITKQPLPVVILHMGSEYMDFSESLHLNFIHINSLDSLLEKLGILWGKLVISRFIQRV